MRPAEQRDDNEQHDFLSASQSTSPLESARLIPLLRCGGPGVSVTGREWIPGGKPDDLDYEHGPLSDNRTPAVPTYCSQATGRLRFPIWAKGIQAQVCDQPGPWSYHTAEVATGMPRVTSLATYRNDWAIFRLAG
jgi:hypothetical protein